MRIDWRDNLLRAAVALSLALLAIGMGAGPALAAMGTVATYTPTTSASGLNKIWRKVQGELQPGINFMSEEWEMLEDLKNFDIDWSAREITVPIDLNEGAGVASIAEGAYEARPSSPNVEEITLTWILLNKRFTASKTARWIHQRNPEAELKSQLLYQGKKAIEDIGRHYSDYSYGFSTGILAKTNTNVTTSTSEQTLTLIDGYGVAGIDSPGSYLTSMFKVGDYIAVLTTAAALNMIGQVTDVDAANGTIGWTPNAAPTSDSDDGLLIVKANSLGNTVVGDTDYNRGLVGFLDMMTSASLHSLTHDNWVAALADTNGGRFSGVRLHKAKDEINNEGGGKVTDLLMAQGVYRDLIALQSAALRFSDPFAMELDGDVKSKGIKIHKTRRVPAGYTMLFDRKSVYRMNLLPKPEKGPAWDDGEKIKDQSGYVFCLDFPCQMVCTNRKNLAYFTGLTEQ